MRLRHGALRLVRRLKVGQRVTFSVTAVRTNGKKLTAKVTPRARA